MRVRNEGRGRLEKVKIKKKEECIVEYLVLLVFIFCLVLLFFLLSWIVLGEGFGRFSSGDIDWEREGESGNDDEVYGYFDLNVDGDDKGEGEVKREEEGGKG